MYVLYCTVQYIPWEPPLYRDVSSDNNQNMYTVLNSKMLVYYYKKMNKYHSLYVLYGETKM
jgi:hypothetical protein